MRLVVVAVVGGVISLVSTSARADEAPGLRCYKVRTRAALERICESANVVTIETMPDGEAPSPAALRAHAVERFAPPPNPVSPGASVAPSRPSVRPAASDSPTLVTARDWSGLRVGLGPWGALSHPAASSGFGLSGHLGFDVVPEDAPSAVLGIALDQTARPGSAPAAGGARSSAIGALTSLNIRAGTVLWGRVMPYVTAGLASSTRHLSLGGGSDLGFGVVYAVDARWSLSLDYRHYDLHVGDNASAPGGLGRATAPASVESLAATLTYKLL